MNGIKKYNNNNNNNGLLGPTLIYNSTDTLNTLDRNTWNYKVFHKIINEYELTLNKIYKKAIAQFFYLLKDVLCCFPMLMIIVTFYRLIPFLIDAFAKSAGK